MMTEDQMMALPPIMAASGNHETTIRDLFPERFTYEGTEPEFAAPLVVLGFFNRSGSTLLGEYLKGLRGFSGFAEHLNHSVVRNVSEKQGIESFPDYFRAAQTRYSPNPKHIHGFKASWDQLLMLKRARIDQMYQGMKMVHIVRGDVVGQAISLVIANQTLQWTSRQTPQVEAAPVFNAARIGRAVQACLEEEVRMRMVTELLEVPYLRVTYEGLDKNPATVIARIGRFLGRNLSTWTPSAPRLERQANELNAEWRERYMALARDELLASDGVGTDPLLAALSDSGAQGLSETPE
jgi:trehalose 2-sulfotransferase